MTFFLQLTTESTLSLQMQYYNNSLSSWEPLIEPVEVLRDKKLGFIPWELNCKVSLVVFSFFRRTEPIFMGDASSIKSSLAKRRVSKYLLFLLTRGRKRQ